ncbi:MAG: hypothetical protein AAGE52_07245 [Myxococcota bacterium]
MRTQPTRIRIVALLGAAILLSPTTASAFTIGTGFSEGCHERITAAAYQDFLLQLPLTTIEVPEGDVWRRVGAFLLDEAGVSRRSLSDEQFFLATSLLVGVRSPDTDGHAVLNLEAVRSLHTDPDPEGQYAHALRAVSDDFELGDVAAVAGTRAVILAEMEAGREAAQLLPEEQNERVTIFFDFYGVIEVQVWSPAYRLGRAAHALQDSFSHTIRDEADEFRTILTVLNFADAVAGTLRESRDGLPHSNALDSCDERTEGTFQAASRASRDLFIASRDFFRGRNLDAVQSVLDAWVRYREGCNEENGFCGNERWLEVLREEPTGPFLCAVGWKTTAWGEVTQRCFLALIAVTFWRRRRKR